MYMNTTIQRKKNARPDVNYILKSEESKPNYLVEEIRSCNLKEKRKKCKYCITTKQKTRKKKRAKTYLTHDQYRLRSRILFQSQNSKPSRLMRKPEAITTPTTTLTTTPTMVPTTKRHKKKYSLV